MESHTIFDESHRIIWLDASIGQEDEHIDLKKRFCQAINTESLYGNPIDICIRALNENAAPFVFVHNQEDALQEISLNENRRIIFICSGAFGRILIPEIKKKYLNVYLFYLFCNYTENYIDLIVEYQMCLNIFNHHMDLFVRLLRDVSADLAKQGQNYLEKNEPITALAYFRRAHILQITANSQGDSNDHYSGLLRLLEGDGDHTGLIERASMMINEVKSQIHGELTQIVNGIPTLETSSDGEKYSEEQA